MLVIGVKFIMYCRNFLGVAVFWYRVCMNTVWGLKGEVRGPEGAHLAGGYVL